MCIPPFLHFAIQYPFRVRYLKHNKASCKALPFMIFSVHPRFKYVFFGVFLVIAASRIGPSH